MEFGLPLQTRKEVWVGQLDSDDTGHVVNTLHEAHSFLMSNSYLHDKCSTLSSSINCTQMEEGETHTAIDMPQETRSLRCR